MNSVIWFLMIVSISADGSVSSVIETPTKPEYNTEAACNQAGKVISEQLQLKLGTNNAKLYWKCSSMPLKELMQAFPSA